MKITAIKIRHFNLPLDPPFRAAWDPVPRREFAATIVEVHTDAGLTGIGSGDLMVGFDGHEHLFLGQDPFDLKRHWQVLDNIDFHYGRCWPLDLALWDLMGKAEGKSVAELLGATRNRILAYASTGEIVSPEERADRAWAVFEQGFKAIKIRFHHIDPAEDIKVVEAVRKKMGDRLDIMVDANQGWRMPWDIDPAWEFERALEVSKALADMDVFWLEEPLPHHDFDGMARLRKKAGIRIAGGEMNRRWHDFREMTRAESLDVYQPDAALTGGITGVKKIAQMVQAKGSWFSPHTWSNGMGLLANLHLACAVSRCPYLEFPFDPPAWTLERRDYLQLPDQRLMIDKEGFLNIPDTPGLGIGLDPDALARYEVGC